jgi:hypothetical protein
MNGTRSVLKDIMIEMVLVYQAMTSSSSETMGEVAS